MSAPRRAWRIDLAACLLLMAGAIVAASIITYDPLDVPGATSPPREHVANLLGRPGTLLAHELLSALGVGVGPLLVAWLFVVLLVVFRKRWLRWSCRLFGWLLLTPSLSMASLHWSLAVPVPFPAGIGGSVGEWLDVRSADLMPAEQRPHALIAVCALGAMLGCGWLLWRPLVLLVRTVCGFLRLLASSMPKRRVAPPRPASPGPASPAPASGEPNAIPIAHHNAAEPSTEQAAATSDERFAGYEPPPLNLLEDPQPIAHAAQDQRLRERAVLLEKTVRDFGFNIKVVGINTGPVVTTYEVGLETGLRVAKITGLADDVALHLRVPGVRIIAPLPGKNAIGIEVPNDLRALVRLKEVIQTAGPRVARMKIPLFLGKDAEGKPLVGDLADMPHLLIAGATGTGKSVCLTTLILSVLMTRRPDEVRLILIDPKSGVEMQGWSRVPHLMSPIIEDMKKAEAVLAWAVDKMEERYDLLRRARVRNIGGYNQLTTAEIMRRVAPADDDERGRVPERMSYVVIVIDEMADLMMQFKKEVEGYIIRLAQKSRAAGIHLVLATQKPTVDVITGLIKSNLPSRICFKVAQKSDSRVVLDQMGADKLLGMGDLLYLPPGTSDLVRAQGAYASDLEINRVADYLESDPCYEAELLQLKTKEMREAEETGESLQERLKTRDKLYEQAIEVVVREGRGSVSLLQRALGIGYGRASRLIDFMAEDGVVGAYNGSNAREVLYSPEQWATMRTQEQEAS